MKSIPMDQREQQQEQERVAQLELDGFDDQSGAGSASRQFHLSQRRSLRRRQQQQQEQQDAAAARSCHRPLILITDTNDGDEEGGEDEERDEDVEKVDQKEAAAAASDEDEGERFEEIDGISYRIVAAVTKPAQKSKKKPLSCSKSDPPPDKTMPAFHLSRSSSGDCDETCEDPATNQQATQQQQQQQKRSQTKSRRQSTSVRNAPPPPSGSRFNSLRRKSSAFVSNLLQIATSGETGKSTGELGQHQQQQVSQQPPRRMSIYEMTKSPPPETSIEHYLKERRRSSTVSAKFVQQQLEQQTTFEANYSQRQQYFKDLNERFINQDKKLLNVVANRGQIHRHSVDIAQLPLELAQAKARSHKKSAQQKQQQRQQVDQTAPQETQEVQPSTSGGLGEQTSRIRFDEQEEEEEDDDHGTDDDDGLKRSNRIVAAGAPPSATIDQLAPQTSSSLQTSSSRIQLASISEDNSLNEQQLQQHGDGLEIVPEARHEKSGHKAAKLEQQQRSVIRKFQKLDPTVLSTSPAPDVKIGQRVAYKEYYGNEFGTIRWIGRVPQISSDWTAGVEFDNAIGEGDGSLNGRRYFIAKDCFAKFLPLASVALVDQHVGRPEPGTMISVMSAAVRPGQMISIQRVSTVHVQHCFLNAPHRRPYGAELLAVNTRLHCQCPNCGPCAHVVKPPRTERLKSGKNATHMCQFSTYTCCGMRSQEEALCTYTGNKISPSPPPFSSASMMQNGGDGDSYLPYCNSWMEGSGYLTNLQAQQTKLMPEEYLLGAGPLDVVKKDSKTSSRRGSGRHGDHADESMVDQSGEQHRSSRPSSQQSSKQKRHHHHHHHHRHKRHHSREKSNQNSKIIYTTNDDSHEASNTTNNFSNNNNNPMTLDHREMEPNHCDYNILQQQNHKPSSDGVAVPCNANNNTSTALVCPEKRMEISCSTMNDHDTPLSTGNGNAIADVTIARDVNESGSPIDCGEDGAGAGGITTKSAKVLYRDSIENRYLFPTDDIIDSTLEADLENLSQARYGSNSQARNQSLSSTKNILKSLRSLVSCLSGATKSNCPSELERHSENTFRFYERPIVNEISNKSQPRRDSRPIVSRSCSCSSSSDSESESDVDYDDCKMGAKNLQELTSTSNDTNYGSYDRENFKIKRNRSPTGYLHSDVSSGVLDADMNMFKIEQPISGYNFVNQNVSEYCYYSNSNPSSIIQPYNGDHFKAKQISLDSANPLVSVGCEYSSTMTTTTTTATATSTATIEQLRRHQQQHQHRRRKTKQVSSSSDCGFSSASQNSINFQSSSQPSCSPILRFDEEQKCINQIYKRIVEKLISSTSAISDEDLSRLRRALFEIHSKSCCLHHQHNETPQTTSKREQQQQQQQQQQKQLPLQSGGDGGSETIIGKQLTSSQCPFETNEECEQIIAEIIRKTLLNSTETNTITTTRGENDDSCVDDKQTARQQQQNLEETYRPSSLSAQSGGSCYQQQSSEICEEDNHHQSSIVVVDSGKAKQVSRDGGQIKTDSNNNNNNHPYSYTNVGPPPKDQLSMSSFAKSSENEKCVSSQMSSLPKTFELKLTLSINEKSPHENTTGQGESSNHSITTAQGQTNGPTNGNESNKIGTLGIES